MSLVEPPALAGVVHRVRDPGAVADFHAELFDAVVAPGPAPGWLRVDVGWNQSLFLAPGGTGLEPLDDRWDRRGFIPIVRTFAMPELEARLRGRGTRWVTPPFDYVMLGSGRLGYVHDPDNQPIGIQQRFGDSVREEDLVADGLHGDRTDGLAAGMGWLILQVADLASSRDFYGGALRWVQRRGTPGFASMLRIGPAATLQLAWRGERRNPTRDLATDPALGVLRGPWDELAAAVVDHGGHIGPEIEGLPSMLDPEGHAWLVLPVG